MTPTNLPVQPASPAVASPAEATASASAQAAPTDFLLMLGQLVGAAVPKETPAQPGASAASLEASDDDLTCDAAELAAFMAMFALPAAPRDVQGATDAAGQSSGALGIAGNVLQARLPQFAAQVQLLANLVQADPAIGDDALSATDPAQLPMTVADAQQTARTAPGAESMLSRPVHQPVGSAAWADEIGSRLTLMAEQGKHTASLRLSPEHLGPLEIRVAIRDDQASVWFGAAHADTRAAIETALPRLRELFAAQGLSLADAGVFREPPRERPTPGTRPSLSGHGTTGTEVGVVSLATRIQLGLVDAYA